MNESAPPLRSLSVTKLLDEEGLSLELVAGGAGIERRILNQRIQKPGLALTGFTAHVHPDRLQVLGLTELDFLSTLTPERRESGIEALLSTRPACIVVTRGLTLPDEMREIAEKRGIPLLRSSLMSSVFINRVHRVLEESLAERTSIHGVLIDVLGVGIVLMGKSGIGKSEAALDLILRGHRLVADDIVEVALHVPDTIIGAGSDIIKHHMEIRGLGIINIKDLFGIAAVRDTKKVELVVELVMWNEEDEYDRLGVEELFQEMLGVNIPMMRVPIRPGRNISSIIEVAARNQLLKYQGKHSAREFQDRLNRAIAEARPGVHMMDEVE